jgi:ADP-ribosylglycohydrolase
MSSLSSSSKPRSILAPRDIGRFRGCLLGCAVGDALGAAIEFMPAAFIRERYGPAGVTDFEEAYGRAGAITDDTQMTLFTAEGLLRAASRRKQLDRFDLITAVHRAYLRWLTTQGEKPEGVDVRELQDGWLVAVPELQARRGAGKTTMTSLKSGRAGTPEQPLNNSKGAGGIMRAAPAGLAALPAGPFDLGRDIAAITHGHPSGYLAAGCYSKIISYLRDSWSLERAIEETVRVLKHEEGHEECLQAILKALELVANATDPTTAVEQLGEGWVADEALAIALYCSLIGGDDFEQGVLLAVNHGGDSDTTGAITGSIMGTLLGDEAIPSRWLDRLELRWVITNVADDLHRGYENSEAWHRKYPPT